MANPLLGSNMTDADALAEVKNIMGRKVPAAAPAPTNPGILGRGVNSFAIGANKYVALPIAGMTQMLGDATGITPLSDLGSTMADNANAFIADREQYDPTQRFQDINSIGSAAKWGYQQASEMVPQIVLGMVAGGAGAAAARGATGAVLANTAKTAGIDAAETLGARIAGKHMAGVTAENVTALAAEKGITEEAARQALTGVAAAQKASNVGMAVGGAATSIPMESTMIYQAQQPEDKSVGRAIGYGTLAAIPDMGILGTIASRTGITKALPFAGHFAEDAANLAEQKGLSLVARAKDVAKTIGLTTAEGTGTEMLQTVIERIGSKEKNLSDEARKNGFWNTVKEKGLKAAVDPSAWNDIIESGAAGGWIGGLMGGGGHALGHISTHLSKDQQQGAAVELAHDLTAAGDQSTAVQSDSAAPSTIQASDTLASDEVLPSPSSVPPAIPAPTLGDQVGRTPDGTVQVNGPLTAALATVSEQSAPSAQAPQAAQATDVPITTPTPAAGMYSGKMPTAPEAQPANLGGVYHEAGRNVSALLDSMPTGNEPAPAKRAPADVSSAQTVMEPSTAAPASTPPTLADIEKMWDEQIGAKTTPATSGPSATKPLNFLTVANEAKRHGLSVPKKQSDGTYALNDQTFTDLSAVKAQLDALPAPIQSQQRKDSNLFDMQLTPSQRTSLEEVKREVEQGAAGFRFANVMEDGSTVAGAERSTFPEYFQNKGYKKREALVAIGKALNGQPLTANQKALVEDLNRGKRTQLVQQIVSERKRQFAERAAEFQASEPSKIADALADIYGTISEEDYSELLRNIQEAKDEITSAIERANTGEVATPVTQGPEDSITGSRGAPAGAPRAESIDQSGWGQEVAVEGDKKPLSFGSKKSQGNNVGIGELVDNFTPDPQQDLFAKPSLATAADHAGNAFDAGISAIKAILNNATDPSKLSSGPTFDDKVYAQIKPHLTTMWFEAKAAAQDVAAAFKEFIGKVLTAFGNDAHQIKPYAMEFSRQVLAGEIVEAQPAIEAKPGEMLIPIDKIPAGTEVSVNALDAEGNEYTVQMEAQEAMRKQDEAIAEARDLIDCVKG